MALSSLFHHTHALTQKRLCKFEIRLDQDFVVLRGNEHETPDFVVSGVVVLMTSETMPIKSMFIEFQGKRRTMFFPSMERERPMSAQAPIATKATFLNLRKRLGVDGHDARTFKPGNYELPFSFTIPGDVSETIEGFPGCFISYGLKAVADRGIMAKDLVARRHLRIIRTLGPDPVELADPQQVSGFWPDKIKYEFNTSSRAAIFGTKVVTKIELTPLMEKLKIGKIRITLKEVRKIRTIPGPPDHSEMWRLEVPIKEMKMDVPEDSLDEDPQLGLPMYKFQSVFELPKSLRECRQSVENNDWIRVRHTLYYDVLLHNPDGHLSELRAHHTIRLFISPNLPVGDDDAVADQVGTGTDTATSEHLLDELRVAPPDYSHHRLDPLYEGIDTSGFMTPFIQSGVSSPGTSLSRRASHEDIPALPSLDHIAEQNFNEDLRRRLANLDRETDLARRLQHAHLHPEAGSQAGQLSPRSGHHSSGSASRTNSYFDLASMGSSGITTPQHGGLLRRADFDDTALSRMPSYGTAVRSNARSTEMPPTYEAAQSQPPSPLTEPGHHGPVR